MYMEVLAPLLLLPNLENVSTCSWRCRQSLQQHKINCAHGNILMFAGMLCTALADPEEPTAVICNATRCEILCIIDPERRRVFTPTQKYSIPVGACFSASGGVRAVHIEIPSSSRYDLAPKQLKLKGKDACNSASDAISASPCCWVVTEEGNELQVKRSSGTSPPLCWHVPGVTVSGSFDVRDQATVEAWEYNAASRREGVKHITHLCSEAAASSKTGEESGSSDAPSNGSGDMQTAVSLVPPHPLTRLLAVLRNIPTGSYSAYSKADFAYVPLTIALEELMAAPLPRPQLQEVARILVSKGLVTTCPALSAAANPTGKAN
jgi:hypothetical protein